MASFDGLGRALRWTRQRQDKKQYEVAEKARVTKAMLSSYENEKQRPTIDTLERILDALEIDVDYLAYAIRSVRSKGENPTAMERRAPLGSAPPLEVERLLGLRRSLEPEEEQAAAQMLDGFHSLLRYMLHRGEKVRAGSPAPSESPSPPASGPDRTKSG